MAIKSHSLNDGQGGHYHITVAPDYESVKPYDYLNEVIVGAKCFVMQVIVQNKNIGGPKEIMLQVIRKLAVAEWEAEYAEMLALKLPDNLLSLLSAKRKSEQQKLTKGMMLTDNDLTAFIAQAGHFHGFLYSEYRSEHLPTGTGVVDLPVFSLIEDDDSIVRIGDSKLSDGQIKNAINHRKNLIGKFIEKDENWHCFVYTYDSIEGKEGGDWGPHIHYISSKWNVPKADIIAGIKNGRYVSSGLPHIRIYSDTTDKPTKR